MTLCLALPLVLLGAEVTTKDVGMVDPVGFYWFWDLIAEFCRRSGLGIFIEYGHRIVGWVVGFCTIVLAVGLSLTSPIPAVRRLGWAALIAVGVQGMLGKYRVDLNAIFGRNLAALSWMLCSDRACHLRQSRDLDVTLVVAPQP